MSKPKNQIRYLNVDSYLLTKKAFFNDNIEELENKVQSILENKISGISFSPYLEGLDPNVKSTISEK